MNTNNIIGKPYPIRDASLKVTGQLKYVGDMKLPNMLYAKMVLSEVAHADIVDVDIEEALKVKGVKAIATCFNTTDVKYNGSLRFYDHKIPENETVFSKRVRFVGDTIAAVAAETEEAAIKACKLIKVTYKELPSVLSIDDAIKEDSYHIHEGGNKVAEMKIDAGDVEKGFEESDYVFEDTYETPIIHHGAIETHSAIASYDYNNKLTIYTPSQNTFGFRILLSKILDIPLNKVRVIRPAIGGAFGGKLELTIEPVVAILSKMTKRPVKLTLTRKESIIATRTRHSSKVNIKTGVLKDGTIVAQDIEIYTNTGAYASSALNVMGALSHKVYKVYKTKNMRFKGVPVYTNTPIAGAMRGYGSPQVFMAQQSQLGKIAEKLNIDLSELQLKNVVEPDGVDVRFNSPIGNPRLVDCINKGKELFGWDEKKNLPKEDEKYKRGIGLAIGAHGNGVFGAHRDFTTLILKLNEDGTVTLLTGTHDMGQGSSTMQSMMISEVLSIDVDKVETLEADTDACAFNLGDYASRGVFVEGGAAKKAAEKLKERILEEASLMLCVETERLYLEGGLVRVKGCDNSVSLSDVAISSQANRSKELTIVEDYASPGGITSYGVHFAEILVDKTTNDIKVVDYVAVHDVGKVINPISIQGQLEGGIQMGLGYALSESVDIDENGKVTTVDFNKYKMFRSNEMPSIRTHFIEEGEDLGPFGAKSIGECAVVPVAPAIVNAVYDALKADINKIPIKL